MQHSSPQGFHDSLAIRARNIRFRGVGNPYEFLDSVGIVPIKEFLFRGNNIIELADTLNLPLTYIHNWIEQNNLQEEIEEASTISAEGYLYRGQRALEDAHDKLALDKAKAMLEHGRFMAAKKDKKKYGTTNEQVQGGAGVTYIFNMGDQTKTIHADAPPTPTIEDAEFKEVQTEPVFALEFSLPDLPEHLKEAVLETVKPVPELSSGSLADRWDY